MTLPHIPTLDDIKKAFGDEPVTHEGTVFTVCSNGTVVEQRKYGIAGRKLDFSRYHALNEEKL